MKIVFAIAAAIFVLCVAVICVFIFAQAFPAIREIGLVEFLFSDLWAPTNVPPSYGIGTMIVGSCFVTAGALVIGVPVGLLMAAFLARYCPKPLYKVVKPMTNILAGIPSIVYGYFGMSVIVPLVRDNLGGTGFSILSASVVLGIMILPTIISVSEAALSALPKSYYEGAVALGMTKAQAVFTVMLPAAKSGVVSGLIMGMGRAIGEAMAVSLVAGNSASYPHGLFSNIRTMTTNIALEMGYATGLQRDALVATGFILLIFVLILNAVIALTKRERTAEKASAGKKRGKKNVVGTETEQKNRNVFAVIGSAIAGAARKTGGFISGGAKKVKAVIIGKRGFSSPETGVQGLPAVSMARKMPFKPRFLS